MNQSVEHTFTSALTSCQQLTYTVTDTLFSPKLLLLFLLSFLLLYVVLSLYKTKLSFEEILSSSLITLPEPIKTLCRKHDVHRNKINIININLCTAMTIGFISPKIVISQSLITYLTPLELEALFLHELHHLNNNHPRTLFYLQMLSRVLFFFPLVKDIQSYVELLFETQADAFATCTQQTNRYLQKALGHMLQPSQQTLAAAYFAKNPVSLRIQALQTKRRPQLTFTLSRIFITLLSTTLITAAFLVPPLIRAQPPAAGSNCSFLSCASQCLLQYQSLPMSNP